MTDPVAWGQSVEEGRVTVLTVADGEGQIPNITAEQNKRGYPSDAIARILGQNRIKVYKRVWAA